LLDFVKMRMQRGKIVFAQTMSPKIMSKRDDSFTDLELDSNFNFEKKLQEDLQSIRALRAGPDKAKANLSYENAAREDSTKP